MISVIVPVYNVESYLEHCINSILKQTYQEIEIIIVNDGSSDKSEMICKRLEENNNNIKVVSQRNQGVSVARNQGIELAQGEYITFVDGDDWLQPYMLQVMLETIEKTNASMILCDYSLCNNREDSRLNSEVKSEIILSVFRQEEYIVKSLLNGDTRCWGKIFQRHLLDNVRFRRDITIGEDLLFLIDVLPRIKEIVAIDIKGYCYYNNNRGSMMTKFKSSYMDQIYCWKLAKKSLGENKLIFQDYFIENKVDSIIMVSTMLVIGKMALLTKKELKENQGYFLACLEEVKNIDRKHDCKKILPKGYATKIFIFKNFPKVYLKLYKMWKR